jgi:aerobic carbon-monoxide dehydrogenase small subunit
MSEPEGRGAAWTEERGTSDEGSRLKAPRRRAGDRAQRDFTLYVNGDRFGVSVEPRKSLADTLREDCQLTGTHLGCEHGVCGACTVLLDGEPVRACLMLAVQAAGHSIRTVEGLAAEDGTLHPLQQAFWDNHGLQCGFCTPGFLMLATGLLESGEPVTDESVDDVLSSNLCRCTGYQNITRAVHAAADVMRQ